MPASQLNLAMEQGATYQRQLTWKTAADGPPVNLTGYTARMQLRKKVADAEPLLELTTENGGITLGGAAGTIDLLVTATQTRALPFGTAVYDMFLVSGGGIATRFVEGEISIARAVTR